MRLWQRQSDFNKENDELGALKGIESVGGRFLSRANRFWWAYRIAQEFPGLNPHEIKQWPAEDVFETLAAIGLIARSKPKR